MQGPLVFHVGYWRQYVAEAAAKFFSLAACYFLGVKSKGTGFRRDAVCTLLVYLHNHFYLNYAGASLKKIRVLSCYFVVDSLM